MGVQLSQHVISRVLQGRHLLRSGKLLNNIIANVMAKAATLYPNIRVYAHAFLSSHIRAELKGPSHQVADFIGYVKREIMARWGHRLTQPGPGSDDYRIWANFSRDPLK